MYIQFAASPVEILDWQRLVLSQPTLSHTASRIATRLSLYINSTTACAWPSLRRLARDSQTSYTSVKRAIKDLVGLNLLQVEPGDAQHTNRYRALLPVQAPVERPEAAPITPPVPTPAAPPPLPVDEAPITQVIDHLNRRADTAFPSTPGSRSHSLVQRALHTQSPDILCAIIDLKADHWAGTERARYLRPETLFNPAKLEGYLSELHQQRTAAATPAAPSDPAPPRRPRTPDTEAVYCAAHALYVPEPPPQRPPAEVVRPHFDAIYRILGARPRRPETTEQQRRLKFFTEGEHLDPAALPT